MNGMRIGFIEPHLERYGGIRRMVELANRLTERGHAVSIYLPEGVRAQCTWLPCAATIRSLRAEVDDDLDVVVFNHEPQWVDVACFRNVRAIVFYALHYARLYDKPGSWASLHADLDLTIANSGWTADRIEEKTGVRPPVVLGGINPNHFRPVPARRAYPILCVGDRREWKGTATIESAARLLGLPLEKYGPKMLRQRRLATEYCRAEVFVVGSRFEGFGWPGLEALACGTPLVTTDNGGSREYALHEQTALVVPPDDPDAMAAAVARLRDDPALAARLRTAGLQLVDLRFRWDQWVSEFEERLAEAIHLGERRPARTRRLLPEPLAPEVSVVVPSWDGVAHAAPCIESIRQHTDLPYELIVVDNGSRPDAERFYHEAADVVIRNERNRGFAIAMNQGLAAARGKVVVFCNDDVVVPPCWATRLVGHLEDETVGVAVPALTAAPNSIVVRAKPGELAHDLSPFSPPPPAVVYAIRTDVARALGGFGEEYELASGEDVDLGFKVWVNGLRIVLDERVLVEHRSKATAARLGNWEALWTRNRRRFIEKWVDSEARIPRLPQCTPEAFAYRRAVAASVAGWMNQYFELRETPFLKTLALHTRWERARRRVHHPLPRHALVPLRELLVATLARSRSILRRASAAFISTSRAGRLGRPA